MTVLTPLEALVYQLESGARPKGGASADTGEIISIGAEHLTDDGAFSFKNPKRIPRCFFEKLRGGRIVNKDILIVKDGATTGKVSFVGDEFPYSEAAINEHVFRLAISPEKADSRYVFHYLVSARGKQEILNDFRGATVGGIGRSFVEKIFIPLPRLSEQRRIAAILDKADNLRRKRKRSLELLDGLTQSIFLEMFGDPVRNLHSVPTRRLSEVATFTSGGTPSKETKEFWTGDIPWVSPKDMKVTDIVDAEDHVSRSVLPRLKLIAPLSTLIVVRGMILAHTAPIAIARTAVTINQDMKAIHFNNEIDPEFGFWCVKVQSEHILSKISTAAHGTKRLETANLEQLRIFVPARVKQVEFVSAARAAANLIDRSATFLNNNLSLFSSLQHRAFFGGL